MASTVRDLVAQFASELEVLIEERVRDRVREFVDKAFPGSVVLGKRAAAAKESKPVRGTTARKPVSAARRKAMQRQGVYLGFLKALTGPDRDKVKAAAKNEGVEAAIALAKKLKK